MRFGAEKGIWWCHIFYINCSSQCVDKMLKGLRGDLRISNPICVWQPPATCSIDPLCLTDLFNSPSTEHIVTGPIGAQLKPEELTRLGGSDRGRKKCSAIMEPNSTHPRSDCSTGNTFCNLEKYIWLLWQIKVDQIVGKKVLGHYNGASLASTHPPPLLDCSAALSWGGKVTFMFQINLSQNKHNAILFNKLLSNNKKGLKVVLGTLEQMHISLKSWK